MASSSWIDRDQEFLELPYLESDGMPVQAIGNPIPLHAGPIRPAALQHAEPASEDGNSLALALALQKSVNLGLLQAIKRLEACVAELSAGPTAFSRPLPESRLRRSVDVLQWVDGGRMPAVAAPPPPFPALAPAEPAAPAAPPPPPPVSRPAASEEHPISEASEAQPGWRKQAHAAPGRGTRQARRSRCRRKYSR